MRNPKWERDEIILALDLYFKLEPGQMHSKNIEVIELSEILNDLPIHEIRPDKIKFRNPNGVGLKLCNFLAIDPTYKGKGMASFSKMDSEIFFEFNDDKTRLSQIAQQIRTLIKEPNIKNELENIDNEPFENLSVKEGKVIFKYHKRIERNSKIINKKKLTYLRKYGKLDCEVCGFDFKYHYGEFGEGFIECHHKNPLSTLTEETETSLDDLALVCANCHRMLHRKMDANNIEVLKSIYKR